MLGLKTSLSTFRYGVRGNIMNVIRSMYENIKSSIKTSDTYLSEEFYCSLGVRQGECLSPFLFSMYLNDIEHTFNQNGADDINIDDLKLVLLLYADDIVLFAECAESLQNSLNIPEGYCDRWKLTVNSTKTKVIILRKGGRLPQSVRFTYKNEEIEIVNKFKYL